MGGKGQRRREKNYLTAHGGNTSLPPPPNAKEHDALPSKLRKLIQLKNSFTTKHGAKESLVETEHGKRKDKSSSKKNSNLKESRSLTVIDKLGDDIEKKKINIVREKSARADSSLADAKKRKRKRNSVRDLRFEDLGIVVKHSKRKERKKAYLKERKKKNMKVKVNDGLDFPGREKIIFGEVVKAPPKLSLPKNPILNISRSTMTIAKLGDDIEKTKNNIDNEIDASAESGLADAKKKKRKRKRDFVNFRSEDLDQFADHSRLKEPKKEFLKEIRNKFLKVKNNGQGFPGRENIISNDDAKAPPKLLPKVPKHSMDASTESLRLQSIELYRNLRGWNSRPGIKLPSIVATDTF